MEYQLVAVGLVALGLALGLGWSLTAAMVRLAPRIGLVDHPDPRKAHARATPLGGGVAIYLSVTLPLLLVVAAALAVRRWPSAAQWAPDVVRVHAAGICHRAGLLGLILAAGAVQMLLGLIDDWRRGGLSYQFRLAAEVALVAILAFHGVRLSLFVEAAWITIPATVLWVVWLTNALNFLDNMDGLAGGVTLIAASFFALLSILTGAYFVAGCFAVLIGALVGFLRHNWSPAKIFMGDAGSNFLGFWVGVLTTIATFHTPSFSHVTIFAPLCVLATPIYDSVSVVLIRLAQGRSPFRADKQHFSHRLVEVGLAPKAAVLLVYFASAAAGISGAVLYFIEPQAAPLVVLQVFCTFGVIAVIELTAWRKGRKANDRSMESTATERAAAKPANSAVSAD